jgi:hypothetical protein
VITEILPSAFAALGADDFTDTLGVPARVGPVRRIAVLLVDGLGFQLLARSPELLAVTERGMCTELQCTLPSTTPASLASLCTGATPGTHGILGFTLNIPGTERVLSHIYWTDDPDPLVWQPQPTVFERSIIASTVVAPALFTDSGLSRAVYRGADYIGTARGDDLAAVMLRALDDRPGLVYGYTARVDTAAHLHGIASAEWDSAMCSTAALIERIVDGLPPDAALLVTADHGGIDVPATARWDIGTDARLSAGVRVVAGEPRFRHLHVVAGAHDDVVATWSGVLGEHAAVLGRDEAIALGLFGAVAPAHRMRIGDVVVICSGNGAVLASGHEPAEISQLVGMHGARNSVETAIPLLSFVAR